MGKSSAANTQSIPIDIAGSSTFGRDPKVMASRTFNMILADEWFQDYFGYKKVVSISSKASSGRGIFTSVRANRLIVVVNNRVYSVSVYSTSVTNVKTYSSSVVGQIDSFSGEVFIDENNTSQIAICDQHDIYIYNHVSGDFTKATLPDGFIPGYVTYQDGYFIAPDVASATWALSAPGNGLNWFWGASGEAILGAIQTKPDLGMATLRVPGRGNLLYVMGKTVTELWTDIGANPFPYQRSYSVNMDYGLLNAATLASSDHIVAWLASNEKSGPTIAYTTGSDIQQLSTDGINFKLSQLKHPEKSSAFFVKLSGHLIYQLTFYDPQDNYTVLYDFTTQKFFDATDEYMNFHVARRVAFFDNDYYFVSFRDGNVYQMSPALTSFDYGEFQDATPKVWEIPRVRVCQNIRMPDQSPFIVNNMGFTVEQGSDVDNNGNDPDYIPRIGLCISGNGGISFGSYADEYLYPVGRRMNRLLWWNIGYANDLVPQFRFYGRGPWKASNGEASVYQ